MSRMPLAAVAVLVAVAIAGAPAASADVARVFTIAGSESTMAAVAPLCDGRYFCDEDAPWPPAWNATARRFAGSCLDHWPDGAILLCSGGRLLRLAADGRMSALPVRGADLGPFEEAPGAALDLTAAEVAPDGGIFAVGDWGAVRVAPDGAARTLVDVSVAPYSHGVDALPDGSMLAAEETRGRIARVWPDGRRLVVAGGGRMMPGPNGVPGRQASIGDPFDVSALPDGSFIVGTLYSANLAGQERVLRVDPAGTVRLIAGGGHGWQEGAAATTVSLGSPTAVHALPDGRVLIGGNRGVLQVDPDGRIHTLVRSGDWARRPGFPDARFVDTDGRPAAEVMLNEVEDVDVLPDGSVAVLTWVPWGGTRLAIVGPPDRMERFAVALPREDRVLLEQGRVDVVTTRPASVHITVRLPHGGPVAADVRAVVPVGRTALAVPPLRGTTDVYDLLGDATTADGRVAAAATAVLPGPTLSTAVLRRLVADIDLGGSGPFSDFETRRCRRTGQRAFMCRWTFVEEDEADRHGTSWFTLRRDGLIAYAEHWDRMRRVQREVLEPAR
jgi:hypothetical protein